MEPSRKLEDRRDVLKLREDRRAADEDEPLIVRREAGVEGKFGPPPLKRRLRRLMGVSPTWSDGSGSLMNLDRDVDGGGAFAFDFEAGIFGGPIAAEGASRFDSTVKTKPESSATSLKAVGARELCQMDGASRSRLAYRLTLSRSPGISRR